MTIEVEEALDKVSYVLSVLKTTNMCIDSIPLQDAYVTLARMQAQLKKVYLDLIDMSVR